MPTRTPAFPWKAHYNPQTGRIEVQDACGSTIAVMAEDEAATSAVDAALIVHACNTLADGQRKIKADAFDRLDAAGLDADARTGCGWCGGSWNVNDSDAMERGMYCSARCEQQPPPHPAPREPDDIDTWDGPTCLRYMAKHTRAVNHFAMRAERWADEVDTFARHEGYEPGTGEYEMYVEDQLDELRHECRVIQRRERVDR